MDKGKIKVVIDSNVFANALMGGVSKGIFKLTDRGDLELILSDDIFAEYSTLIEYPNQRVDLLLFYMLLYEIHNKGNFIEISIKLELCKDKEDNKT